MLESFDFSQLKYNVYSIGANDADGNRVEVKITTQDELTEEDATDIVRQAVGRSFVVKNITKASGSNDE